MAERATTEITALELRVGDRVWLDGPQPETVVTVERLTDGLGVIVRIHLDGWSFDAASWELFDIEPRGEAA